MALAVSAKLNLCNVIVHTCASVILAARVICHEVSPTRRFGQQNPELMSVTRVFLVFFRQQPETTLERCSFDFRIPGRHEVDGIALCAQIARLFDDVGEFSMFKINLSYFPSKARLNFRWIFKEFDLKSNMKGFFENFLAVSVKKLRKVLMILPSITGPGRAFLAESCCYMPCLGISNFYRSWIIKVYSIITINRKCRYMFLLVSSYSIMNCYS